ncbi:hypothetical protein BGW36DRAFT_18418 [Talaromyces proteolyticus]|uniref:FAD/NAD(P)-binding domain-containing protein n=1 Tax=Talaromyces proteolyticus TaxID=1131652 RepID=A0AAD4Q6N2_9EURO|nr:uncharacterized protein BGW36DRAFT_18418 [Talaromyces proteolyticus]KAH8705823.1 hypothetical protein BGW36DRAFT_18418 [Talaromyces proteolyticus]
MSVRTACSLKKKDMSKNELPNESAHRASSYRIPDITYRSPENRRVKVIAVGAGFSGIQMAYKIQKQCENVEFQIYEKNPTVGGTWLVNRYPGCACDVPSHAYSFNFALNPDWPLFFSHAEDIQDYLEKVVNVFNLRKYMLFNSEVMGCHWNEVQGIWTVKIVQTLPDGTQREIQDTCDLLLQCTGVLSRPKLPKIEGLDRFKGKIYHTGAWDNTYTKEQWKKENVAVIGSGASSVQAVPNMQVRYLYCFEVAEPDPNKPYVKHMDVFVRTAVWFVKLADNYGNNHAYTDEEKRRFRSEKQALASHARDIENQVNGDWNLFFAESKVQNAAREFFTARMAEHIKDQRLLEGFTPKWSVGCRRVTPGDPYMKAIQEPNVDVHFTGVRGLLEMGVVGEDGIERKVDTVICATGYDVSYHPNFPIIGQKGTSLSDQFGDAPECYLGITVPNFPNYILFGGPTWPAMNGSALGPLHAVGDYALQVIKKMQVENLRSFAPRQDITDRFNAHVQEFVKVSVWKDECRSWYKNPETGKVFAIWPGSSLHYMQTISSPRWEDYNITYHYENPWAHLGFGFTLEDRDPNASTAPYLTAEAIDDDWMAQFEVERTVVPKENGIKEQTA